ncbi:hypothetical protein [Anaerovibrio sp. RM50]|nr:hypothetical protein [Anaerovibrio sp. RM50]
MEEWCRENPYLTTLIIVMLIELAFGFLKMITILTGVHKACKIESEKDGD